MHSYVPDNLTMDESSSPQSHMEDRISELPDSLIHMILSFIDMKYVVQTSVLSKRWQNIWRSLSVLNLDASRTGKLSKFISFVHKVLWLRDDDFRIQRFQLNFRKDRIDLSHIHQWIAKAIKHNVEELYIKSHNTSTDFSIFSHICTCKSLTKLELGLSYGFNFGREIASTSVILPRLKSIILRLRLHRSGDNQTLANQLFTKCPALESLILDFSRYPPANLNISVPKLKHFTLTIGAYPGSSKVTLCAPNLSSFTCFSNLSGDHCLEGFPSHVTADVRIDIEGYNENKLRKAEKVSYAGRLVELMRGIHNVKMLSLTNHFKVLAGAPVILGNRILHFPNLQRLILRTWLSRGCINAIIYLLRKSPNLEYLELNIEPMVLDGKDTWDSAISSPFKLHHLKHIVIRGVGGYGNEVRFMKIMLENAMALEKVVLLGKFSDSWRKFCRKKLRKKLEVLISFS